MSAVAAPYAPAQVPPECSPGAPAPGDTIVCETPAPGTINTIRVRTDDVTVEIGPNVATSVDGATDGVNLFGAGGQTLIIHSGSSVHGADQGVQAIVRGGAGGLTILSEGAISGGRDGIVAINDGDGATHIDVIDVTGLSGDGIFVQNEASATDVTIVSTGTVSAGGAGVFVFNFGAGSTSVTVNDVSGDEGVFAVNLGASTDLSITATGEIEGRLYGVIAENIGLGATTIDVGDVSGGIAGISVVNGPDASDLTVTSSGVVSGGREGTFAANFGTGSTTLALTDVYGDAEDAIFAENQAAAVDLNVMVSGAADGELDGVHARNFGTGATSISVGSAIGRTGNGISAVNGSGTSDLSIRATGSVVGDTYGIEAENQGAGALIIVAQDTTGGFDDAISARNAGTDLTIVSSGDAVGDSWGIYAVNNGSGAATVHAHNSTGFFGDGVRIVNRGTDLAIVSIGRAEGDDHGIHADNLGSGALTIVSTDAAGGFGAGIDARNSSAGTDLIIDSTGSATGYDTGIVAHNFGSGATEVSANSADGDRAGIDAFSANDTVSIMINGAVSGGDYGVFVEGAAGSSITVSAGGSVSSPNVVIEFAGGSDDTLDLANGAAIDGDVLMGEGDDVFNAAGGGFTFVDGGLGTDTINFSGPGRTVADHGGAGDPLSAFEIWNFASGGFDLSGTYLGLTSTGFLSGANTLSGALQSTDVLIGAGATLIAADGAALSGRLTNSGAFALGQSPGVATVTGDYVQTAGGTLFIEVWAGAQDQLIVTGDVTLDGALVVDTDFTGFAPGSSSVILIDGGTGLSGAFLAVDIVSGLLIDQTVSYDAANFNVVLTTDIALASSVAGLTANQSGVGDSLILALAGASFDPGFEALIQGVGGISDAGSLGATLDEFAPSGFEFGLRALNVMQGQFLSLMAAQTGLPGELQPVRIASLQGTARMTRSADPHLWASIEGGGVEQGGGNAHGGLDGGFGQIALGVSGIGEGPVRFGFAGGYSRSNGDAAGLAADRIDTALFHLGAHVRAELNPDGTEGLMGRFDAAVGFADGEAELTMALTAPGPGAPVRQTGSPRITSFDGSARVSLEGRDGRRWAVRPYVEAEVAHFSQDAARIGSGLTALSVDEMESTRWNLGLGAQAVFEAGDNLSYGFGAAVVQYFGATENVYTSRFLSAPSAPAFVTTGREIEKQLEFEAGLSWTGEGGWGVGLGLFGETGDLDVLGGRGQIRKRF